MKRRKNSNDFYLFINKSRFSYINSIKKLSILITSTTLGLFFLNQEIHSTNTSNAYSKASTQAEKTIVVNSSSSSTKNLTPSIKHMGVKSDFKDFAYNAEHISRILSEHSNPKSEEKIVFLTFDDGTSNTVTPKILDTLDEYNVKATFFITGQATYEGGVVARNIVKRVFNSGHAIGNHSYSHNYKLLFPNRTVCIENIEKDLRKNELFLKSILGEDFSTRIIRCPGGTMSWKNCDKLYEFLDTNNLISIDWNALNGDSESGDKSVSQLVKNAIQSSKDKDIVVLLMHDTYGKENTAKALGPIIEYFKSNGYVFKTLI